MSEKIKFQTVDQYISAYPKNVQEILRLVRKTVKEAVPQAEEVISYNIPAFKYHGWLIYYSAYARHFSLSFPPPFTVFEKFKKELSGYKSSKSTVQMPLDKAVPVELIRKMVTSRAEENVAEEEKKKKK